MASLPVLRRVRAEGTQIMSLRNITHESWHQMTVWKCPYCAAVDGPEGAAEMPMCVGPTADPHPAVLLAERTYVALEDQGA